MNFPYNNQLIFKKIYPELVSMHTIKPLDKNILNKIFKKFKNIIIIEEHSAIGGLGSAVSEYYTEKKNSNKILKLNIGNDFVLKSGNQNNAYKMLKLSANHIEKSVINLMKK